MSIDNTRECVTSKYFMSKAGMEESLSDFQETKPNCKGPKTTQKVVKPKARKVSKRIKGQKDIRTALKGKKNDLISYTKEFDNVCKKSGLDVDSEQLQVAIALSKSLQTGTFDDASTSQSLTTQSRIAKIRTTLQEYGFKVPENKITATNKKVKKHKRQYKLLNTTEEERDGKIRNKYSEVLIESAGHTVVSSNQSYTPIYNIASNLEYDLMRNNDIFYVDTLANLIERSTTIGSLLRNYSEIPGRPVSPVQFNKSTMDFSEILSSQDELDVILSGPIKSAYAIIKSKHIKDVSDIVYDTNKVEIDVERKENIDHGNSSNIDQEVYIPENTAVKSPAMDITKCPIQQYRSCSPDIFDDEVSSINEISKPVLSQEEKTKVFTEGTNCMDLTECAYVTDINFEQPVLMSINTTKRKSNDLMELTECAVTASQGIHHNIKEIDLTQSPEEKSLVEKNCHIDSDFNYVALLPDNNLSQKEVFKANNLKSISGQNVDIDLTQNNRIAYTEPENITAINKMCVTSCDDIDLTQSSNEDDNRLILGKDSNNETESVDLTQSSKSSLGINDLPDIDVGNSQNNQTCQDDTIILNEEEYIGANGKVKHSVVTQDNRGIDLSQSEGTPSENHYNFTNKGPECHQSFYDDFIHEHTDSKENIDGDENYNANDSAHNTSKESKDIDLTQSSDEGTEKTTSPRQIATTENTPNNSSLGKKDDISIDYDEVCDYVPDEKDIENNSKDTSNNSQIYSRCNSSKSQVYNDIEIVDIDNDFILNCSQQSEVFDLTDKELDYSLHKSKLDYPMANYSNDFGEISVIDNELGGTTKSLKHSVTAENNALDESFLPEVDIKQQEKSDRIMYDNKKSEVFSIVTPKNSKYIIKTEEVTPMIDYASLTTPQRNKELDKYGLKPFKRKRAIQILTHLYNQTHPIMEPYSDDDQPSSAKKPKHKSNELSQISQINSKSPRHTINVKSPRKGSSINVSKSPRQVSNNIESPRHVSKNIVSPRKEENSTENVNSYGITSMVPNIRRVDCNPEDWVFQKKEKAKIHTCRVPLHIAFHNYVSSRRDLREAILKYEPVNIDVIHKDLVSYGHRYDSKDLLRFLDKKCITVKTTDNNTRNKR